MAVHCFLINYKSSDKFGRNQTEPEVQFEIRLIGGLSIEICVQEAVYLFIEFNYCFFRFVG